MTFISFSLAFMMALITFYVNQRIHKMRNVKILINTLFSVYGNRDSFKEFNVEDVPARLMTEIIEIEKLNDDNYFIDYQLKKLRKLRMVYFNFHDVDSAVIEIENIKFKKLNKSFIVLAFLDIEIPYIN
jgi:hypothetical protein